MAIMTHVQAVGLAAELAGLSLLILHQPGRVTRHKFYGQLLVAIGLAVVVIGAWRS